MSPDWDVAERAARAFEDAWRDGEPSIEEFWTRFAPDRSLTVLTALVKVDIRCRFARGESPTVDDYLKRFPVLMALTDRVVSLIYEEYCLREERGEPLDPARFCDRYEPWRDSLESQLRYHLLLSQVAGKAPSKPRFPEPGDRFGWFQLRSMLGQGGVARVYLARDEELGGREVALKVSPDRGQEPSIMGRLDHPHIVPVLSVAHEPESGLRGLCMPYRPGLPLDEVLRRIGAGSNPRRARGLWDVLANAGSTPASPAPPFPRRHAIGPGDGASTDGSVERSEALPPGWEGFPVRGSYAEGVAWIILTLARALGHAHSHQILHLDVKPANVLLSRRDGPQLLDFNLAHEPHAAEQAEFALRGGTLPYMAPEQLEAFLDPTRWKSVGEPADLYSLGLLLRELLTGRLPEVPDPTLPVPRAIREMLDLRERAGTSLRTMNPALPHALDAIAARCLAFAPVRRYQKADELADDLQRFLLHQPLLHAPNTSKTETARNWTRRNARRGGVVLAVLMAGSVLLPWLIPHVLPAEDHWDFREGMRAIKDARLDDARRAVERLKRWYPRSALPDVLEGVILEKRDNSADAEAIARVYQTAVGKEGAVEAFRRALEVVPNSTSLHVDLAILLAYHEQWPESARHYRAALDLDPDLYAPYRGLAQLADAHEDDRKAYHDFMDQAVRCAERRPDQLSPGALADLHLDRALASVKWMTHPKASRSADSRRLLEQARDDLRVAEEKDPSIGKNRKFGYCQSTLKKLVVR